MLRWTQTALLALLAGLPSSIAAVAETNRPQPESNTGTPYFRITVVDEATGRGIPLVKLAATNRAEYWTDSAGVVAFAEPDMMGTRVQLFVETYGYSMRTNVFNQQAVSCIPRPGESMVIKMRRDVIAQRLYRLTGTDIYRDSRLLGDETPPTQDPSPLPVTGMDSVVTAVYRGKMYWIWGDTGITSTNLGNFLSTGATSELPGQGGLDPETGVYYTFFRRKNGHVQPMVNTDHNLVWLGGMHVARDPSGKERLFTRYAKIKPPMVPFETGLAEFNDQTNQFDIVWAHPDDAHVQIGANHFRHSDGGVEYFYQGHPLPSVRCRTDVDSIKDIYSYEALTCLKDGSDFDGSAEQLARDDQGRLAWGWRRNTSVIGARQLYQLVKDKLATPADAPYALQGVTTGERVLPASGSVYWNDYRQRWVGCILQIFGASMLGEVWYFEGDTPVGPWVYGEKTVTHRIVRNVKEGGRRIDEAKQTDETYAFYNVKHHAEFDRDDGRAIYFEGTYTAAFSGTKKPTPRYDYNQMMYKLELDDPRLRLPVPVYRVVEGQSGYYTTLNLPPATPLERDGAIAFFAPDLERPGTAPVYQVRDEKGVRLSLDKPADPKAAIAFYAVPSEPPSDAASKTIVPLYEYTERQSGRRFYSVKQSLDGKDAAGGAVDVLPADAGRFQRSDKPLCRVWPNPIHFNPHRVKP